MRIEDVCTTAALVLAVALAASAPAVAADRDDDTYALPFAVDLRIKYGPLPANDAERSRWLADPSTAAKPHDRAVERCLETPGVGTSAAIARERSDRARLCEGIARYYEGRGLDGNALEYRRRAISHRRHRAAQRAHMADEPTLEDKASRLALAIDLAAVGEIDEAHNELREVLARLQLPIDREIAADVAHFTALLAHDAQRRGKLDLADRYLAHARDLIVTDAYIEIDAVEGNSIEEIQAAGRRHFVSQDMQDLIVVLDVQQTLTRALEGDGRYEAATYAPIAAELLSVLQEIRNPRAADAALMMAVFACCLATTRDHDYVTKLLEKLESRCDVPDGSVLQAHSAAPELACQPGIPEDIAYLVYQALIGHAGADVVPVEDVFLYMSLHLQRPDVLHLHDTTPVPLADLETRCESALAREFGAGVRVVIVPTIPLLRDENRRSDQVLVAFVELPATHPAAGTSSEELIQSITTVLSISLADSKHRAELMPGRVRIGQHLPEEPDLERHRIPFALAADRLADLNMERAHDIVTLADVPALRNARCQPLVESFHVLALLLDAGEAPLDADWHRPAGAWEAMVSTHILSSWDHDDADDQIARREAAVAVQVTGRNVFHALARAILDTAQNAPRRRGELLQSLDAAFFAADPPATHRILRHLDGAMRHELLWMYLECSILGTRLPRWDLIDDIESDSGGTVAVRWVETASVPLDGLVRSSAEDIEGGLVDMDALHEALRLSPVAADYVVAVEDLKIDGALEGMPRVTTLAAIVGVYGQHEANPAAALHWLRKEVARSPVAVVDPELYEILTTIAMAAGPDVRAALHELDATLSARAVLYPWAFADQEVVASRIHDLSSSMEVTCQGPGERAACEAMIEDMGMLIRAALDDDLRARGHKEVARAHITLEHTDEALRALAHFVEVRISVKVEAPDCLEHGTLVTANTTADALSDGDWAAGEIEKLLALKPVGLESRLEMRFHLDWPRATSLYAAGAAVVDHHPEITRGAVIGAIGLMAREASMTAVIDPAMADDVCRSLTALRALGVEDVGATACPAWDQATTNPEAAERSGAR